VTDAKSPATADERTLHLRDYWRTIWNGRWLVLAVALLVPTLVAIVTFMQTPIYRAATLVEIQPRPKSISPSADFSRLGTTSYSWLAEERYINTQLQIVRSRGVARAVIADLGLETSPQFAGLDDPAGVLAGRIKLDVLVDTYALEIAIEDADPKMAQLLANGVAHAYIDNNVRAATENVRRVIDELYKQVEPIKTAIAEKEASRIELSRQQKMFVSDSKDSVVDRRMRQLQEELTDVQISRGQREATFNEIETIEKKGASYLELRAVAEDAVVKDLTLQAYMLEKELEKLSLAYRARHPKVQSAKAELEDIRRQIVGESGKIIAKIKTEYAIDKRREADLLDQLSKVREEGLDLSQAESQIAIYDADLKEDRRIYDLIMSRIKEIGLNQQTMVNNIRLMDEAVLPRFPVRPRKALNLAAGVLLGLLLGVGTVFFVDYLDNTIKSTDDIERYLGLPILAVVPKIRRNSAAQVKEAFQTLRTSILFASKARSLNTILVTSAGPGEGKSSTIVGLARTLASAGDRVLLMDADLRRPSVHANLDVDRDGGLTNFLMGREGGDAWKRYVKATPGSERLEVMTCGPIPPNPVELFGQERFQTLLGDLRRSYDWVLIDSPPVASMSDSIVLASQVDMVVLMVKHNENDRELIRRSAHRLREIAGNLVGAVLNQVDLSRAAHGDYYYAGYYYSRNDDEKDAGERSQPKAVG